MKKAFTIISCLFVSIMSLFAQLTEAVNEETYADNFIIVGNDMYTCGNSSIRKADLSQNLPVTSTVYVNNLESPVGMTLNGNDLYFTEYSGGRISKIDISNSNPTPEVVLSGLSTPNRLVLIGNDLYFTESSNGRVAKIDITEQNPTISEVVNGLNTPTSFAINENEIYIMLPTEDKIVKADISQTLPVMASDYITGIAVPAAAMINNNIFYFSDYLEGVVLKVDITQSPPVQEEVYSGLFRPNNLVINGNSFYISERDRDRVLVDTSLFPTPANDCVEANDINPLFSEAINVPQVSDLYTNNYYSAVGDPTNGFECHFEGDILQSTIWYSFVGTGHTYNIRTIECGATDYIDEGDTQLAIYTGSCGSLTPVPDACSEDEDADNDLYNVNLEDFETESGVTYYMLIDGNDGLQGEFCLEVTKTALSSITNIDESDVQIYPNPAKGIINLQNVNAQIVNVYDNMGRLVVSEKNPGMTLDISELTTGMYSLKITTEDKVYSAKVMKQ